MTTPTPLIPSAPASPAQRGPLRLDLARPLRGDKPLDGSWWPQSRDLSRELADLVDNFPEELGRVQRVVYSRPDWDTAPHRVRVARGTIKVGSYPRDDTRQVWLSMSTHRMIRLAVTASEAVSGPVDADPVPAPRVPAGVVRVATEHWTDDGGSWWDPHPVAPSDRI